MPARLPAPRPAVVTPDVEYQCIPRLTLDFGYSATQGRGPEINVAVVGIDYTIADTDADGLFRNQRPGLARMVEWPPEVRDAAQTLLSYCEQHAVAAGQMDAVSLTEDL